MGERQDISAHERMTRVVAFSIGAAGVLFLLIANPPIPEQWPLGDPWWQFTAIALMVLPAIVLAVGSFHLPFLGVRAAAGTLAVGQLVIMALMPIGFERNAFPVDAAWPWVLAISAPCIMSCAIAWSKRAIIWYVPIFAVLYGFTSWWAIEGADAFRVSRFVLGATALGVLFTAVAAGARKGGADLDAESSRLRDEAAARSETEASAIERARLDGLVHDHVLAALLAAGQDRADSETVRVSIAQAIGALVDVNSPPPVGGFMSAAEAAARLRQLCANLDESATVHIQLRDPVAPVATQAVQIMQEVTAEALRNSLRHAGTPVESVSRSLRVEISDQLSVVIRDDGAGFDPLRVPPQRLGIAVVMRGRLQRFPGARMTIDSAPGAGTVVTAAVPAEASGVTTTSIPDLGEAQLLRGSTAPDVVGMYRWQAIALGAAYVIADAARPFETYRSGVVNYFFLATLASLVAGAALLLHRDADPMPRHRAWLLSSFAVVTGLCNIAAASGFVPLVNSAIWAWSSVNVLLAFLCVRGKYAEAWITQAALCAIYFWWYATLTVPFTDLFWFQVLWNLMLLAVCTLFARSLRRQVTKVNAIRARSVVLAAERGRSQALLRERDEVLRYLNAAARPLLNRLAQNPDTDADIRLQSLRLEARLRDRIRARALASDAVLDAAEAARARGVDITLLDDGALEAADSVVRSHILTTVEGHLHSAASGHVTVRVMPPGRDSICTIVHNDGDDDHYTEMRLPTAVG